MSRGAYRGSLGNDTYLAGAGGFRFGKLTPGDWYANNELRFQKSDADRGKAKYVKAESQNAEKVAHAKADELQYDVTQKITDRLRDTNDNQKALQRYIEALLKETDLLFAQKQRLENTLKTTEVPLHIATDCLKVRETRHSQEQVEDDVELSLLKEVETLNNIQDLLDKVIKDANDQLRSNRSTKSTLELDWSDKLEASNIDTISGNLNNHSTDKVFKPAASAYQNPQSDPKSWARFTHENLKMAEDTLAASTRMRKTIDDTLSNLARDMRQNADNVEAALHRRTEEENVAIRRLYDKLQQVLDDIGMQEKNIAELQKSIKDKEEPMKVAQTRLQNRMSRPGVENCRDSAQYKMIEEVSALSDLIAILTEKLEEAEQSLRELNETRMALEKELDAKKNSVFVDDVKCRQIRRRFPTFEKLMGYMQ